MFSSTFPLPIAVRVAEWIISGKLPCPSSQARLIFTWSPGHGTAVLRPRSTRPLSAMALHSWTFIAHGKALTLIDWFLRDGLMVLILPVNRFNFDSLKLLCHQCNCQDTCNRKKLRDHGKPQSPLPVLFVTIFLVCAEERIKMLQRRLVLDLESVLLTFFGICFLSGSTEINLISYKNLQIFLVFKTTNSMKILLFLQSLNV